VPAGIFLTIGEFWAMCGVGMGAWGGVSLRERPKLARVYVRIKWNLKGWPLSVASDTRADAIQFTLFMDIGE